MMVDRKILQEIEKEGEPEAVEAGESIPTTQSRQTVLLEEAVVHPLTEEINRRFDETNRRIDALREGFCDRLGELVGVVESLKFAEPETEEEAELVDSSVTASLSDDQRNALDGLNAKYEQIDMVEVRAGFARGGGVYRPDTDLLYLKASTKDQKFVNWPTLAEDDFDPGISVPANVKFNELDSRKMSELVEHSFTEKDYRKNAWLFSKEETDQWIENLQILLGIDAHSKVLPLFWRIFSEELSPEQLLAVYQEEMTDREAHQREREAKALKIEMMPVEDGGRLADWSIYHFCQELGIDFPDEETRRRLVAKAEQSIRPAKAS